MNMKRLEKTYGEIRWAGKKCILGLPISFTSYIVTGTKLITKKGFVNIHEDEIELYRIIDKTVELPFGQRMVGCGTLRLTAKDCDTPVKELKAIKHVREAKRIIDEAIEEQRSKFRVKGKDMFGAVGGFDEDVADSVSELI